MGKSKKTISQQFDAIVTTLKTFGDGASIENIKTAAGLDIDIRTLQRRLAKLKKQGVITTSGDTRSTRYHVVQEQTGNNNTNIGTGNPVVRDDLLPQTRDSKEILEYVSLPEGRRTPVGYTTSFLEGYLPNSNSYLTQIEKDKLAVIGQTQMPDQPAGTYAKEMLSRLLIDLSFNSSRLEGNTYSLLDTERLISRGEYADDKSSMEAQMILNHKDAIKFIVEAADDIGFNRYTLLNLHALLSFNLLPDSTASGRLRRFAVGIKKSVYTPLGIPQQIESMFNLMLEKAGQILNPFEQAFFIMVHLPYLQPFDDVNKRVSRLAANIPLNRHNFAPLSFIDVPHDLYIKGLLGVYELNRIQLLKEVFIWAYERSAIRYAAVRQTVGEPDPFRMKYRDEIRGLITEIVSKASSKSVADFEIKAKALRIPEADRAKFIEVVETELLSLHEGNIATYWIRPSEFKRWKDIWESLAF